jgi:competence protein ComGF
MGILDEHELMEMEDGTTRQFELYDNISQFIEAYEDTKKKKKTVKKPKGLEKFLEK